MEQKPPSNNQLPAQRPSPKSLPRGRALGILAVVAIGFAAYNLMNAVMTRQRTGLVVVKPSVWAAAIHVGQGSKVTSINSSAATLRLKPGTYQITLTGKKGATSKIISVTKQGIVNIALDQEESVPVHTIADYQAQDILAGPDNNLYFFNLVERVPYVYPLGSDAAKAYRASLSDVTSLHWISPTQLVTQNRKGEWMLQSGNQTQPITFHGEPPVSGSVNFSTTGAMAFITGSKQIVVAAKPSEPPRQIATAQRDGTQVSIAPNGDALVYVPYTSHATGERTRLYRTGKLTLLPGKFTSIANVRWNTNSTAFSYTTNEGSFIYNPANKSVVQILAGTPTNPTTVFWLNPTTLIYADSGAVWKFDTKNQASRKLLDIEGNLITNTSFSFAPDGKSVYFSTTPNSDNKGGHIYSFVPNYRGIQKGEQTAMDTTQIAHKQPEVAYSGFDMLIPNGMTTDQVASLKFALGRFGDTTNTRITSIHLGNFSMVVRHSMSDLARFDMRINNSATYKVAMDITDISAVRLRVFDSKTQQLVFDSQTVSTQ